MELVLKTSDRATDRGFESHPLRQTGLDGHEFSVIAPSISDRDDENPV